MDYEFRIELLEKELTHAREMQEIMRGHLDKHDTAIEAFAKIAQRVERNLETLSAAQIVTEERLTQLTQNVNTLVSALLREHPNGKGQK